MIARRMAGLLVGLAFAAPTAAHAQTTPAGVKDQVRVAPFEYAGGMQPVMDNTGIM